MKGYVPFRVQVLNAVGWLIVSSLFDVNRHIQKCLLVRIFILTILFSCEHEPTLCDVDQFVFGVCRPGLHTLKRTFKQLKNP